MKRKINDHFLSLEEELVQLHVGHYLLTNGYSVHYNSDLPSQPKIFKINNRLISCGKIA